MTRWIAGLVVSVLSVMTLAGAVPLTPFAGANFTVSMPRSWNVVEDAANGLLIARQNAAREDSAGVLFLVKAAEPNQSEDQLLDTVLNKFATNVRIIKRDTVPTGGHRLIADGVVDGNSLRLGVIALVVNGASVVSLLMSKPAEFEPLGGIDLVTSILLSLRARDAPATPAAPPSQPSQSGPVTGPGGKLIVPPLARTLTFADLAGEWNNDDSVLTNYVTYRGDSAGFESIATREKWIFDGRGGVSSAFSATTAGRGGARQMSEKKSGAISFSPGPVMTLGWTTGAQPSYIIRGWRELPGMTVLMLNGPWYGNVPADVLGDRNKGVNLNSYWVRKAKP